MVESLKRKFTGNLLHIVLVVFFYELLQEYPTPPPTPIPLFWYVMRERLFCVRQTILIDLPCHIINTFRISQQKSSWSLKKSPGPADDSPHYVYDPSWTGRSVDIDRNRTVLCYASSHVRESGIQQIFAVGIRNPETRIRNPQWFGIRNPRWYWNPEIQRAEIQNPDAGIRKPGLSWILLHRAICFIFFF